MRQHFEACYERRQIRFNDSRVALICSIWNLTLVTSACVVPSTPDMIDTRQRRRD